MSRGGWAVEGASPYRLLGEVRCAAKSLRSLRIYICSGRGWAVQILCSDITFIIVHTFFCFFHLICTLSAYAEWGSASNSARDSVPWPCKPSNAGLEPAFKCSLRSVQGAQLWSALLIPHSSFLTPHSSFLISHSSLLTLLALPLDETTVK